jgi:hypothetical protein
MRKKLIRPRVPERRTDDGGPHSEAVELGESSGSVARIPKVLIGLPNRGTLPTAFVESLNPALLGQGDLFTAQFAYANWHITDEARNKFAETALEQDFDFLFMMDVDMIFPTGVLARMIRNMGKIEEDIPPVLAGLYCSRSNDNRWHVYNWAPDQEMWESLILPFDTGLVKVDAIGTGCMLLDVNVFQALEWPWFEYEYRIVKGKRHRLSEDMVFCERLGKIGIPIYADTSIRCGHMHSVQIWPTSDGGSEVKTLNGEVY